MSSVLFDKDETGRVALITLNRPECLNAYDTSMRDGLYEALSAVRDDPETGAVVLQGNGPAFCSGGDLREFGSAPSPLRAREIRWRRDVWGLLWNLDRPVVAAVHGYAVGGGFEMAMLASRVVAARTARFALPETGLGMIPGVGGTQTLPRLIGTGRALDLVLSGAWLDAAAAQRLGLVQVVVPEARLRARALQEARALARLPQPLVAALLRSVREGGDLPVPLGLAVERLLCRAAERAVEGTARRAGSSGEGQ